jgi:hypothetical protein
MGGLVLRGMVTKGKKWKIRLSPKDLSGGWVDVVLRVKEIWDHPNRGEISKFD